MSISYVRLKPYDPSRGNVRERFRMGAACGWGDLMFIAGQLRELDTEAAKWLGEHVYQVDDRPSTPKAFDVWHSKEECAKALRQEKLESFGRAKPHAAVIRAHKPPELKHSEMSDLDEPPATSDMEAEMMANLKLASMGDVQEDIDLGTMTTPSDFDGTVGEFDDIAPSDSSLASTAMADPEPPISPPKKRPGRPRKTR